MSSTYLTGKRRDAVGPLRGVDEPAALLEESKRVIVERKKPWCCAITTKEIGNQGRVNQRYAEQPPWCSSSEH